MKVLVCGGRDFKDYTFLADYLDECLEHWPQEVTIIHGNAKGADQLAFAWAVSKSNMAWWKVTVETYPADWNTYGKRAGYIRNKQMLDEGNPDLVIAFPGGVGTAMMIKLAREKGVEVIEVKYPPLTICKTCGILRDNSYGCYC